MVIRVVGSNSDIPVYGTAVVDRDDEDNQDAVIDRKERTVHPDAAGIDGHLFVSLEFLDTGTGVLFGGKIIQGRTDTAGIFFGETKNILLGPAGELDGVHVRSRGNRRIR